MAFEITKENVPCDRCCEVNLVTTTHGHREWEERFDYACAHCGAHMGSRRAVGVSTQESSNPVSARRRVVISQ